MFVLDSFADDFACGSLTLLFLQSPFGMSSETRHLGDNERLFCLVKGVSIMTCMGLRGGVLAEPAGRGSGCGGRRHGNFSIIKGVTRVLDARGGHEDRDECSSVIFLSSCGLTFSCSLLFQEGGEAGRE